MVATVTYFKEDPHVYLKVCPNETSFQSLDFVY